MHSTWGADDYARRLYWRLAPRARTGLERRRPSKMNRSLAGAARRARVPLHFVRVARRAGGVTVG